MKVYSSPEIWPDMIHVTHEILHKATSRDYINFGLHKILKYCLSCFGILLLPPRICSSMKMN